jgi:predicted Holliday junction resolvase-like endonuclease
VSVVVAVFLIVGVCTLVILAAIVLGLINHVRLLGRSLAAFQRETEPILQEIRAGAVAAQAAAERMEARRAAMQRERERSRRVRPWRRRRR